MQTKVQTTICEAVPHSFRVCPLAPNRCLWQHRITNECQHLPVETANEYAELVGLPYLSGEQYEQLKQNLRTALEER